MRVFQFARGLCIAGAIGTAVPAIAQDASFTSVTVFGDSLVDAGNVYLLTSGATPPASGGYFDGRFTNGYDYTDLLSIDLFGTPTTPSLAGGTNFAFGGARVTSTSQVPDLQEQLALFGASGQAIDPTGLYVLNFGGNDIFAALQPGAPSGYATDEAYLMQAALLYAGGIQTLADLGVQNFLVTGFPVPVAYSGLADSFFLNDLSNLTLDAGTNVYFYSYLDFYQRLLADPTAFGLPAVLDLSTTCQAAAALPDCTGYLYFDGTHPTAAIQEAVYNDINRQFSLTGSVPEPATWAMMLIGFGAVGWSMRRNRYRQRTTVSYG